MRMAEGHGQRVGGIRRLRLFAQSQLGLNHLLHLLLGRAAMADDAGLDFARRITVRRNPRLSGGEENHAANFGELQSGAHVQSREYGFYRNCVGSELLEELRDHAMNAAEARGEIVARGEAQGAEAQHARGRAVEFHHAVARRTGERGVNSQDAQSGAMRVAGSVRGWRS